MPSTAQKSRSEPAIRHGQIQSQKSPLSGTRFGLLTDFAHKFRFIQDMKIKAPLALLILALTTAASFAQTFSWNTGTYVDNMILDLVGPPSNVQYAINLGGAELSTENGYLFLDTSSPNITYLGFNIASPFVSGGTGISFDAAFNSILGDATFFTSPGTNNNYTINNLVIGNQYQVMFLMADTRTESGIPGRSFTITAGDSTSPSQVYAFPNGTEALGGYAVGTFTATATSQTFVKPGDGQLNAIMVASVPEPSALALVALGAGAVSVLRFRRRYALSN